jgi:hypothetical protein
MSPAFEFASRIKSNARLEESCGILTASGSGMSGMSGMTAVQWGGNILGINSAANIFR